jgi:hypothetical protein
MAGNNRNEQQGDNCHRFEESLDKLQTGSPNVKA